MPSSTLLKYLLAGNHTSFNQLRKRERMPSVSGGVISDVNISYFQIDNMLFMNFTFKNCIFDAMKETRFYGCTFEGCTFANDGPEKVTYSRPTFFKSSMIRNAFKMRVDGLRFEKCDFKQNDFDGCEFRQKLTVIDCTGFPSSKNLVYAGRDLANADYRGNREAPFVQMTNWESLRFLLSIPIARISWIVFLLNAMVLSAFYIARDTTNNVLDTPLASSELVKSLVMSARATVKESAILHTVSQNILISLVLLAGSIMFSYACPSEIKSYDRRKWVYEIKGHTFVYEHLSTYRTIARLFAGALLAFGTALVLYKYSLSLLKGMWHLLRLAIES